MIAVTDKELRLLVRYKPLLERLVKREGAYSNNPHDAGGETMWGITERVARENGFTDSMRSMSRDDAKAIYLREYIIGPRFDEVYLFNNEIGEEMIDTGVNMGQPVAAMFLQRALNAFNHFGKRYPDVRVDGKVGDKTLSALNLYLQQRGKQGVTVLLRALNSQQGDRYLDITEKRPGNEEFAFGWFLNRVEIAA